MEKLVLVTHDKNQGLLGAQSTKLSMPDSMTIKIKNMPQPLLAKRDTPKSKKEGPSMRLYTVKDWIQF